MNEFTTAVVTSLAIISIGYVAKRLRLLDIKSTRELYKFLFTIPLPIVVFTSLASSSPDAESLKLPLVGGLIAMILVGLSFVIGKILKLDRKTLGTLMTTAGITSTLSFALPFILVFYGQESARYLFLFDFGGAIVVWTFVYYISGVMGNKRGQSLNQALLNLIKAPMVWALVLGFIVSVLGITVPDVVNSISSKLASFVSVLILLGIGVFFVFNFFAYKKNFARLALGIFITMILSALIAYVLTNLFGITGVAQKVVIISALAPTGALAIPFCAEHDLDVEYASALLTTSTALAVIFVLFALSP
ncbi:MAG: malate permease [Patescibacteria group bacterium]|nr:malate permease [Patescibacteria group bacterium]